MNNPNLFRKYIDILNEQEPTAFQQGVTAVKQQYQNYQQAADTMNAAVKSGAVDPKVASAAKSSLAGSMVKAGVRAGMQGGDPGVYMGSMMGDVADAAAGMSKQYADVYQKYAPGSTEFKKLSPAQQAQFTQAFSNASTPAEYDATVSASKQSAQQMMNPAGRTPGAAVRPDQADEYVKKVATQYDMTDAAGNPVTNEEEDLQKIKKFIKRK